MLRARTAALACASITFCALIVRFGFPPDEFAWLFFGVIGICVGIVCAGVVASIRHLRTRRRFVTLTGLLLLLAMVPFIWRHQSARATLPAFLATADSVVGIVEGHNVTGNLLFMVFDTLHADRHRGRYVGPKKRAHASLSAGDTVWVFVQREGRRREVGRTGPDGLIFVRRLALAWLVAGALICGYGPYFVPEKKRDS